MRSVGRGAFDADLFSRQVRQGAGLLLKNNLKQQYAGLPEQYRAYIKDLLLLLLPHPSRPLRQTAGSVASVVVESGGLASWPQLVVSISASIQSGDEASCDGGLSSLYKVGLPFTK